MWARKASAATTSAAPLGAFSSRGWKTASSGAGSSAGSVSRDGPGERHQGGDVDVVAADVGGGAGGA